MSGEHCRPLAPHNRQQGFQYQVDVWRRGVVFSGRRGVGVAPVGENVTDETVLLFMELRVVFQLLYVYSV